MLWVLIAAVIVGLWLRSYTAHARSGGVIRGLASRMTVTRSMSATAVRRGAYVTRPTTHIHRSTPPRQVGIEVGETGRWKWTRRKLYAGFRQVVLVIAPPGAGKALALDTPIATPTGWTTMGELRVGDRVFDRDGVPCSVTATSEVFTDHDCYEVTTRDGERIVADAGHLWVAKLDRRWGERVHTTQTLARKRSKRAQVRPAGVLKLPERDLPLHPYVLGLWLGDGRSKSAHVYTDDPEVLERVRSFGYTATKTRQKFEWLLSRADQIAAAVEEASALVGAGWSGLQARRQVGLNEKVPLRTPTPRVGAQGGPQARQFSGHVLRTVAADLRDLNVLRNKHVPIDYLRASAQQRLMLLQGLIDSDGYVSPSGFVEFSNINRQLAVDVRELACSLGVKASLSEKRARIDGRDCGEAYRVCFYLAEAAWLRRKAERCRNNPTWSARYLEARRTATVPTKCIAVDSPSHTYLAGRTLLPTHNSGLLGKAVQDAPGAVVAASTRSDLYEKTIASRSRRPVYVFNPYDVGGIPNTLRWSPIHGCADQQYAMRTAGLLVAAGAHGGQKDAEFWEDQAVKALRCLLAAADLANEDMHEVVRWAGDLTTTTRPTTILEKGGMKGWAADLRDIKAMPEKTRGSLSTTLSTSLQFMAEPHLAELATPSRDEQFDPREFIRTGAAVYILGRHREHDPVAPLFSALFTTITDTAADIAERSSGQRLDPPLTLVLDEVTNIFRVPLDQLTSFAGGLGVPMVIAAQGHHQLRKAFGPEGAKAVWSNAGVKVTFGGDLDEETLKMLSLLCGDRQPTVGSYDRVPVLPPARIARLQDGKILVLRGNTPPILGWSQPVWERTDPPVAEPLVPDTRKASERHLYVVKEAS